MPVDTAHQEEEHLREGGGVRGKERQRRMGRLPVRERLSLLIDNSNAFFEIGLWAAYEQCAEAEAVPAAGLVTGVGDVCGRF